MKIKNLLPLLLLTSCASFLPDPAPKFKQSDTLTVKGSKTLVYFMVVSNPKTSKSCNGGYEYEGIILDTKKSVLIGIVTSCEDKLEK